MSKALLQNTYIFSFATINFPLQRTQHSSPQEIFGRFHSSLLISGSKAGNLACTRKLRSREGHSSFILSCNLIGQRENKSFDVTELVLRLGAVGLADVIFRRSEATAGNTSAFAGYCKPAVNSFSENRKTHHSKPKGTYSRGLHECQHKPVTLCSAKTTNRYVDIELYS